MGLLLCTFQIQAQTPLDSIPQCGYDLMMQEDTMHTFDLPANFQRSNLVPYIIPTVVHILHSGGEENISDAQVHSAIAEMNMQFAGGDGGTNSEITFRLATRDPDGNCTTGIERIFNQPSGVHLGGSPSNDCTINIWEMYTLWQWPTTNYFNIWIVDKIRPNGDITNPDCSAGGIRGVSGGGAVAVRYDFFGTIEMAAYANEAINTNTETHEAGHYLGLHHPWGPGNCSSGCEMETGADCLTHGDQVCDTDPCNSGGSTMDCSNPPLSCTDCTGFDFTDYTYPLDNYMSYSTLCQNRFTPGQIERMHGKLESSAMANLISNGNLDATGTSDAALGAQLDLAPSISPASCPNQVDGAITVSVSNGSGAYSYLWNTGATTATISGLEPGWYSVEVQDNVNPGCAVTASYQVPGIHLTYDVTTTCVQSNDGAIDITVFDASDNELTNNTYLWSNGATTQDVSGLAPGDYSVTITTPDECVLFQTFEIDFIQRPIIEAQHITVEHASCSYPYGSIFTEINSFGNSATFIYEWTDASGAIIGSGQHLEEVPAGMYTIKVTNPYTGCTSAPYNIEILDNSPEYDFVDLYVVNGTETMNGSLSFLAGIKVPYGATLNITNAQLEFSEFAYINVSAGGKLVIENSELKNVSCAPLWKGIYIEGNENYSQSGSGASQQGRCLIENSEIENALVGLSNKGISSGSDHGGMMYVLETTFRNCRISVEIKDYANVVNGNLQPIKNRFYNSTFIWDEDFPFVNDIGNPSVLLRNVYRPKFQGCKFINQHEHLFAPPNNHYEKAAIYGFQSSIDIESGCNGAPPYAVYENGDCLTGNVSSKISGFNYGIVLMDGSGSIISKTDFNCYRGVWSYKTNRIRLTQSNFNPLPSDLIIYSGQTDPYGAPWNTPYGAYLDYTTGFWLEANRFEFESTLTGVGVGLILRNTSHAYNRVYSNTFSDNIYGLIAYDMNRGVTLTSGLKIECNTYNENTVDNAVHSTTQQFPSNWGISAYQGVPPSQSFPFGNPTGNTFLDESFSNVFNMLDYVNYYYHTSENLMSTYGVTLIPIYEENDCPSSFPSPMTPEPMAGRYAQIISLQSEADSLKTVLESVIDGGNTPALTNQVILAQIGDAVELYYDLMQKSPNLSKAVMMEAIQKEYELPAPLLSLILRANPHAAKLSDIQKELDQRLNQLTPAQRALINEGLDLTSYKEGLEATQSHLESQAAAIVNRMVLDILSDTTIIDKTQAIESFTADLDNPQNQYFLIDWAIKKGDLSSAQSRLDALETWTMNSEDSEALSDLQTAYGIQLALLSSNDSTLSPARHQILENLILSKPNSLAAAKAQLLLKVYAGVDFHEVLVEPDWQSKTPKARRGKYEAPPINQCKVYPNPTEGILIVEVPVQFETVLCQVISVGGQVVMAETLGRERTGLATVNLRHLPAGVYTLHLTDTSGQLKETHRISLSK